MKEKKKFIIAPSLLSANLACLGEDVKAVLDAGADCLHLDVMDNHYVPNLTMGPLVCEALRSYGIKAPIDVHLMVKPVDSLIVDFAKSGASYITFHPEATLHLHRSLDLVHREGCKVGLALNPGTSWRVLEPVWSELDFILVMSVNPGFGGQTFISSALKTIAELRQKIDEEKKEIILAVDGGIKVDNIAQVAKSGANMFIAGSAIFKSPSYKNVINAMRQELSGV